VSVKSVHAQIPAGILNFGIRAEAVANETGGAAFASKSFKVTEARKLASDAKQASDQRSDATINGDSSMRILLIGALIGLWAPAAHACEGQKGKVLYDNSGGSPLYQGFVVKATGAETSGIQPGHFFNQADYCLEVVFPPNDVPPNDPVAMAYSASVRFLSSADSTEFYLADLTNSGVVSLYHGSSPANVVKLWSADQKSTANLAKGSSNAIEAVVKGSTISVLLNGKLVKTIRAQIPNGDLRFGFDLEVGRAAPPGVFTIKSIKVTEAQ
jgi:hypothetical protein